MKRLTPLIFVLLVWLALKLLGLLVEGPVRNREVQHRLRLNLVAGDPRTSSAVRSLCSRYIGPMNFDVLTFVSGDGQILSSGHFPAAALHTAQAAFLTNATHGLKAVDRIEGAGFTWTAPATRHPLPEKLMEAWRRAAGAESFSIEP